jgi:hypothetical protein
MRTELKKTAVRWKERISGECTATPASGIFAPYLCGYSAGHPTGFRPISIASIRSDAGDRTQERRGEKYLNSGPGRGTYMEAHSR